VLDRLTPNVSYLRVYSAVIPPLAAVNGSSSYASAAQRQAPTRHGHHGHDAQSHARTTQANARCEARPKYQTSRQQNIGESQSLLSVLMAMVSTARAGCSTPKGGWLTRVGRSGHQLVEQALHLHPASHYCNVIEAPWLVNGGHGASLISAAPARPWCRSDPSPPP
jgi:hypothetical protein